MALRTFYNRYSFITPFSNFGFWRMSSSGEADFLTEKNKLLNMSTEDRRKGFKKDVSYFEDIDTWATFYENNKDILQTLDTAGFRSRYNISPCVKNEDLNKKVSLWQGDITNLEIDAVVNAANSSLLGGGGVDGAIHRGAGKFLLKECQTLHGCATGDAKITGGYRLPSKYIIHTVGPQGEKPGLLQSCYRTCLQILQMNNLKSIAFPCVSTGIYGYPQDSAANIALKEVKQFLETNGESVDRIVFCLFLQKDVEIYQTLMQLYFPVD